MIDRKAFRTLSSGLYVVSSRAGEHVCGCVVNTLVQVASEPATLAVSLNKENATTAAILESGRFCAAVLAQEAPMELIGTFGFRTSAELDKFAACQHAVDTSEVPYLTEHALARFSACVTETVDVGSHYLFVGVVEEADVLGEGDPLTYAYYHAVKGGKTPPKAATYNNGDDLSAPVVGAVPTGAAAASATPVGAPVAVGESPVASVDEDAANEAAAPTPKRIAWRCSICGYIEEDYPDGLPVDYMCPICGAGPEMFERIELSK